MMRGFNLIHKTDLAHLLAGLLQAHLDAPGMIANTAEIQAYSAGYVAALRAVATGVGVYTSISAELRPGYVLGYRNER